jgi:hypothetical protein
MNKEGANTIDFFMHGRDRLKGRGLQITFHGCLEVCLDDMESGGMDLHTVGQEKTFVWGTEMTRGMWDRVCAMRPRLDLFWSLQSNLREVSLTERRSIVCQEYLWQDLSIVEKYLETHSVDWVGEEVRKRRQWQCSLQRAWILAMMTS